MIYKFKVYLDNGIFIGPDSISQITQSSEASYPDGSFDKYDLTIVNIIDYRNVETQENEYITYVSSDHRLLSAYQQGLLEMLRIAKISSEQYNKSNT